jgi:hypothetical protein
MPYHSSGVRNSKCCRSLSNFDPAVGKTVLLPSGHGNPFKTCVFVISIFNIEYNGMLAILELMNSRYCNELCLYSVKLHTYPLEALQEAVYLR